MKKVCFIIPYFGKFNNYFELFLESCKNNPTINWLIITDDHTDYNYPKNIRVIYSNWETIRQKFVDSFDFEIKLLNPYELCDFKVSYGLVFNEYLNEFDFWGYCDTDLIFGDIRKYLTDDILDRFDKVFCSGHCTIYRNTDKINRYFLLQQYRPARIVFNEPYISGFDEWGGISKFFLVDNLSFYDELVMDDILPGYQNLVPTKAISSNNVVFTPYHVHNLDESKKYKKMKAILYCYQNGRLFRLWMQSGEIHKEEILYVHLQKRMMLNDVNDKSKYYISNNRFFNYNQHISDTRGFVSNTLSIGDKMRNIKLFIISCYYCWIKKYNNNTDRIVNRKTIERYKTIDD